MNKKVFIFLLSILFCCGFVSAQQKSELQQRAESDNEKGNVASARFHFIRAFEDYANKGQMDQGVECAVKATGLYYKEGFWKEAFDLLRRVDQTISAQQGKPQAVLAGQHYMVTRERLQMYLRMRKAESAKEHLKTMEAQVSLSGDESLKNDLLYNKAVYYYTFGQNAQGNAVFKEMASKLTAQKEYDKVDGVYQTLISNARKSGNANMVAQSYNNYMVWKDSVSALKTADKIDSLKQQIADNEAVISDKDSSLTARWITIVALGILVVALAAALVIGGFVLMRFILQTRKQKKVIKLANENNALKAKFISNISAQLEPTLQKLDNKTPEVQALQGFSAHIQTLSDLENSMEEAVELEEVQMTAFCEKLIDQIRDKVKADVTLTVNAPKMSALIYPPYVEHILLHLLNNAALYTPEGGKIWLDFKKRGAHTHQFIVSDTGTGIPEEQRENIFKPFTEIRDLTKGDGLGLPICKQMALKMDGDLEIDPEFTKGTRFVLDLKA